MIKLLNAIIHNGRLIEKDTELKLSSDKEDSLIDNGYAIRLSDERQPETDMLIDANPFEVSDDSHTETIEAINSDNTELCSKVGRKK